MDPADSRTHRLAGYSMPSFSISNSRALERWLRCLEELRFTNFFLSEAFDLFSMLAFREDDFLGLYAADKGAAPTSELYGVCVLKSFAIVRFS